MWILTDSTLPDQYLSELDNFYQNDPDIGAVKTASDTFPQIF